MGFFVKLPAPRGGACREACRSKVELEILLFSKERIQQLCPEIRGDGVAGYGCIEPAVSDTDRL
jgi:hypothetical protein